jgi:hypothetical protein
VLDFVWYPTASPRDPASFCFVASVRECPVKLLDASDGRVSPWFSLLHYLILSLYQLRASYKIVDHRERFIAPHSLAFNLTAQKCVSPLHLLELTNPCLHKLTLFHSDQALLRIRRRHRGIRPIPAGRRHPHLDDTEQEEQGRAERDHLRPRVLALVHRRGGVLRCGELYAYAA